MSYPKIESIYLKLLKVQNLLNTNLSELAKEYDFNSTELMIFLDIKSHPNTDLNALCDRLGLKKSAASKAINKLIKDNHIQSHPNLLDQRKIALSHNELEDKDLCTETILTKTFKGIEKYQCNIEKVELALDDAIKMLKKD